MSKELSLNSSAHKQLFQDLACNDQVRSELLSNPEETLKRYHIEVSSDFSIELPSKETMAQLITKASLVFSSTDSEEDFDEGRFGGGLFKNLFNFRDGCVKLATCR